MLHVDTAVKVARFYCWNLILVYQQLFGLGIRLKGTDCSLYYPEI